MSLLAVAATSTLLCQNLQQSQQRVVKGDIVIKLLSSTLLQVPPGGMSAAMCSWPGHEQLEGAEGRAALALLLHALGTVTAANTLPSMPTCVLT